MAGEVHGIISREDAWRMWAPYGERVIAELAGDLEPDTMNWVEAKMVVAGASDEDA